MDIRIKLRALACCLALCALAAALSGCGSGVAGPSPNLSSGPGRITGSLVLNAPSFEIRSISPDHAELPTDGVLDIPGEFTLFADGDDSYTRSLWQQGPSVPGAAAPDPSVQLPQTVIPGRTAIHFDFSSLPLSSYRLGFIWMEYGDFDMPNVLHAVQPLALSLSAGAPEKQEVEYSWGSMGSPADGSRLRGRICLNGNAVGQIELVLSDYSAPPQPGDMVQRNFRWVTNLRDETTFGRVFFELGGLAPGSYSTSYFASPGQAGDSLWQENETDPAQPPALELLNVKPDSDYAGLVWYGSRETWPDDAEGQAGDYSLRHRGVLDIELQMPSLPDLSQDTLIVAEAVGGVEESNDSAWNYIVASHFNAQGIAPYRLRSLKDGQYRLRLLQLGPDNTTAPTVLAELADPVTVEYPHSDPIPDEIWEPHAPYGSVVWTP